VFPGRFDLFRNGICHVDSKVTVKALITRDEFVGEGESREKAALY